MNDFCAWGLSWCCLTEPNLDTCSVRIQNYVATVHSITYVPTISHSSKLVGVCSLQRTCCDGMRFGSVCHRSEHGSIVI